MLAEKKVCLTHWELKDLTAGTVVKAHVPGDITYDLYQGGMIEDPYYGDNFKHLRWVAEHDFAYTATFMLTAEECAAEDVALIIKGIDTFADIYVNDAFVGSTDNMFKQYEPDIKGAVHPGENLLRIHMRSTLRRMEEIDTEGYFGVFNIPRLFVRKAQCHFGWDWAPDLCGYGIWQELYVSCRRAHRIDNVNYQAYNDGTVTFFTELNYCTNAITDNYGVAIDGTAAEMIDDTLRYTVWTPDGMVAAQAEALVDGKKNFYNLAVEAPRLWWPNGYGEQPLYPYEVALYRGGEEISCVEGKLAFREVELIQKPTGADTMGFVFCVNGTNVFVRGSNWVPVDCFTGVIPDDKYRRLIHLAKNANFNLLRVWGGGVYEKDIFYDLCDQEGIMVPAVIFPKSGRSG